MELQWVVGGQRYDQTSAVEFRQRIAVIVQEERVVRQRRHGDTDLRQIVEVLQHRRLTQQQAVSDVLAQQVATDQVIDWAGFTTMRPQHERVQTALSAQVVQHNHVRVHVIEIVQVRRVLLLVPLLRQNADLLDQRRFVLRFVVHAVEAGHVGEELVQVLVLARVHGRLEQRLEDVPNDLGEIADQLVVLEHVVQTRHLNQPSHVVRVDVVGDRPVRQRVPFLAVLAVDRQSRLGVLVLALVQIAEHLLENAGEVLAVDIVVSLQEDLS